MLRLEWPLLAHSEQTRTLNHVLDLSSIHVISHKLFNLITRNMVFAIAFLFPADFEECPPDLTARGWRQLVVFDANVDAGFEGWVDSLDTVGGEEEGTLVVF